MGFAFFIVIMKKLKNLSNIDYALVFALVLGVIFRLLFLTKEGLWHDEALTAISSVKSLPELVSFQLYIGHSPLYLLIIKPFVLLFGNSELVLRLSSVIFGVLAIYAMYLLVSRLFEDKWILYTSSVLFAFSALQIHFSQEARPYTMIVFFSILSFYYFVKALDENAFRDWALYAVTTIFAVYLSVAALPILAVQFVYTLIKKRGSFGFNLAFVLIIIIYLPMIIFYMKMGRLYFMQWVGPLSLTTFSNLFFGYLLIPIPVPQTGIISSSYAFSMKFLSFVLLLPLAAGISLAIRKRGSRESFSVLLLWLWIVIPLALEIIYSLFFQPIIGLRRYLIAFSPALYMLLSHGVWVMSPKGKRKGMCIALIVLFSVPLLSFYSIPKREDWRGAITYMKEQVEEGEPIFTDFGGVPMLEYYWEKGLLESYHVKHLYSVQFDSGWIIMRNRDYIRNFGEEGMLKEKFKISEPGEFIDIRLVKLKKD